MGRRVKEKGKTAHGFADSMGIVICVVSGAIPNDTALGWSGMRPMWEEQGWSEEPEGEEQGEIQNMLCLREEMEGDGGMRTLEQEVSEEETAKMNYKGK